MIKIQKKIGSGKGFTLIELILYIAIASIVLGVVTLFLRSLVEGKIKSDTIAEVEQQGLQITHRITRAIRSSEGIISPAQGLSGASLTLDTVNASDDPTIFDLAVDTIRITEGAGSAITLNNGIVTASNLLFYNVSSTDTPGIIKIEFVLTSVNPAGRNEYDYTRTFYGTAALRL